MDAETHFRINWEYVNNNNNTTFCTWRRMDLNSSMVFGSLKIWIGLLFDTGDYRDQGKSRYCNSISAIYSVLLLINNG